MNAARLEAYPAACKLQLPGLHASAADKFRESAMDTMGHIYPLLVSGCSSIDNVEQKHMKLFGFRPIHPGPGNWSWNGNEVVSSSYGTVLRQSCPVYSKDDPTFGMFKDILELKVGMQFEHTGLRTEIRWKMK